MARIQLQLIIYIFGSAWTYKFFSWLAPFNHTREKHIWTNLGSNSGHLAQLANWTREMDLPWGRGQMWERVTRRRWRRPLGQPEVGKETERWKKARKVWGHLGQHGLDRRQGRPRARAKLRPFLGKAIQQNQQLVSWKLTSQRSNGFLPLSRPLTARLFDFIFLSLPVTFHLSQIQPHSLPLTPYHPPSLSLSLSHHGPKTVSPTLSHIIISLSVVGGREYDDAHLFLIGF